MSLAPVAMSAEHQRLRDEVRTFIRCELGDEFRPRLAGSWEHSPAFSRRVAERGWIGMTLPERYGGGGRSLLDRFVVVEELLAAGAPIGAHLIADRQSAPMILRFGPDSLREEFLPAIVNGTCWFCVGMSEPDSGSDLASIRTNAKPTRGGWLVTGTKVWVSSAHRNHFMLTLCRTSVEADRHDGMSQMVVDLRSDGVQVHPIPFLDGTHGFNEVVLNDVFVPDERVLGEIGAGWRQVTSELSFERAGPDRYVSSWTLLSDCLARFATEPSGGGAAVTLGRLACRMWAIRQLSLAITAALDAGENPSLEVALAKDVGTKFEQEVVEVIRGITETELQIGYGEPLEAALASAVLISPSFTLRGGTTEILRTTAAKKLLR